MPAMNPSAFRLFVGSSALSLTLFSKFEPTLGEHIARRNSVLSEDKLGGLRSSRVISKNHHGGVRRQRRALKQKDGSIFDETYSSSAGTLKNVRSSHQARKGKECDPDLGILSCKEGEYCKKVYAANKENHLGGVCVGNIDSLNGEWKMDEHGLLMERPRRRLAECNSTTEVELNLIFETDYYSYNKNLDDNLIDAYYDTYWGVYTNGTNTTLAYADYVPGAPANYTFCVEADETNFLVLSISDSGGDGISVYPTGEGLSLAIVGADQPFVSKESYFFTGDTGVPDENGEYGGEYVICFKCPFVECCYPVYCDTGDNASDIVCGSGGGGTGDGSTGGGGTGGGEPAPTESPTEKQVEETIEDIIEDIVEETITEPPTDQPSGQPSASSSPSAGPTTSAAPTESAAPSAGPTASQAPSTAPTNKTAKKVAGETLLSQPAPTAPTAPKKSKKGGDIEIRK